MNIKSITTFAFVLAIVLLMVGLSACDQIQQLLLPTTPQMEELSGEILIGVVLPVTGRLSSAFGMPMGTGFELAREEINNSGRLGDAKITFIIEDDQSESAVEAFNKLIHQDGVSVILGPATSSQAKEAFPIAQENQVVAFSPTSAARGLSAIGDFVFRAALTTDVLIPSGIETTSAKLSYKTAATMYDENDVFSIDSDEAVREAFAAIGVKVLITETFQGGIDTNFSAQLTRIKDANPEAIFISSLPPEKPGILTQGRQLGIPDSVPFIMRTLTEADVQAAGEAAEGAITFVGWASTADTPGNQAFVQNHSAKYGVEPGNYTARSYAALHILAEAIANAQSTDSTAIRDAMANITDFDTVFGKFSFDAVGDAVYDPKVLIVVNGQLEIFE